MSKQLALEPTLPVGFSVFYGFRIARKESKYVNSPTRINLGYSIFSTQKENKKSYHPTLTGQVRVGALFYAPRKQPVNNQKAIDDRLLKNNGLLLNYLLDQIHIYAEYSGLMYDNLVVPYTKEYNQLTSTNDRFGLTEND